MNQWSIDILRQSGFDLWTWVCIAAAVVLATYAVSGGIRTWRRHLVILAMIVLGVGGTIVVVAAPALHTAAVGMAWTFILLSLLSATFYASLFDQLGARRMLMLLGLRILALALLASMLFEPVWRYVSRPKPERPLIFLVDKSGSMSVPDVANGPSRIQSVWQTLQPQLPVIEEHFVPQYFTFAGDVQAVLNPQDLGKTVADGKSTDIVQAIGKGLGASDRDDAVVVLFSDGQDNVSPNVVDAVRDSRRKICTITVGSDQAQPASIPNVAVDNVACDDDFTVGRESSIVATITSTALPNRLVDVKMAETDAADKPVGNIQSQQLVLQPVAKGQTVTFTYTPPTVGVHKLAVWIDPIPGERTTVDNRQEFQGLALDPRIKVLYVEGRARPEYKFLNLALKHDPNIEESTLLRVRGNQFEAAGKIGNEPLTGLPQSLEQWKKFDVIILGDLDSSFLSFAQQSAIEEAVSQGTGLLMIGGQSNFGAGGYKGTAIEKALPVWMATGSSAQDLNQFLPQLTAAGQGHPVMEGLADWFMPSGGGKPKRDLREMLRGNVIVGDVKTGAEALLVHPGTSGSGGQNEVVLAVERYGKGRSGAFTADTTWQWYQSLRDQGQENPYNRFWGQLVRWLAGEDVRGRQNGPGVTGLLNKSVYRLGETVRVRALVRDTRGDATSYAQVSMTLTPASGQVGRQLPLTPDGSHVGMYETRMPDANQQIEGLPAGDYTVDIVASKDNQELGRQRLKFSVIQPDDEMLKIAANAQLMKDIAEATGGFSGGLEGFGQLLSELIRTDPNATATVQQTVPLANTIRTVLALCRADPHWPEKYDLPMQGLLVMGMLCGEWVLRRKWQLA